MKIPPYRALKSSAILMFMMSWVDLSQAVAKEERFCQSWSQPRQIGTLPYPQLKEASGLALSHLVSGRAYWINDSGDKAQVYYATLPAPSAHLLTLEKPTAPYSYFKIMGPKPVDSEALVLCKMMDGSPCLLLADIGDNRRKRAEVELIVVKEEKSFPKQVAVHLRKKIKFPDGPHDIEAVVMIPNGDLLFFTKELYLLPPHAKDSYVFRLSAADLWTDKTTTLELLFRLPITTWLKDEILVGQVITDASFNKERGVIGLLTYRNAIEIKLSSLLKSQGQAASSQDNLELDYRVVTLQPLPQQETLSYTPDGQSMIWSSETMGQAAQIFSMVCER